MLELNHRRIGQSHPFDEASGPEKAHFGASDIGWQALAPALSCTIFASLMVAARWYSRCKLAHCLGSDDYVIMLSLTLSWAMTVTIGASVHHGVGVYHSQDEAVQIARLVITGNALWILIVNITKASILTQYLRIFSFPRTRLCCYTFLAALLPAAAYSLFAGIFLCSPTEKLWRPGVSGTCRSAQTYWLSVASLDITLDTLVLLLPLPAILSLRLPPRQKFGLVMAFTLGFTICAVSVARLVTVYITAQRGKFVMSGVWAVIWNAIEANVGIICACLLAFKPLAAKFFPSLFDEERLPQHSTHLNAVDTTGAGWGQVRWPTSLDVPATPSSGMSGEKEGCVQVPRAKRWSSARTWMAPEMRKGPEAGLSEVENLGMIEREPRMASNSTHAGPDNESAENEEQVTIWDVLQRPEGVAAHDASGGIS